MCVNSHREPCWLRGNLHLHNKCYMKSRALFTCMLSYWCYSYLLSGLLPSKNRKFFILFTNYICHVQAKQSLGEHSDSLRIEFVGGGQSALFSRAGSWAGFNNTWGLVLEDFSASCVDCMHAAMSREVCPLQALVGKESQQTRVGEFCVWQARSISWNQTYFKIERIILAKHLFELYRFISLQHSMWKCEISNSSL